MAYILPLFSPLSFALHVNKEMIKGEAAPKHNIGGNIIAQEDNITAGINDK